MAKGERTKKLKAPHLPYAISENGVRGRKIGGQRSKNWGSEVEIREREREREREGEREV